MKELKCRFKGLADGYEINFKNQSVLVSISIGQDSKNTTRFSALLKLIFQHFENCTITLHDTLQRYTMAIQTGRTSSDCYQDAMLLGDQWLAAHQKLCNDYGDRIKIIRWDEWLNHTLFKDSQQMIKDEIQNDSAYKQYFTESIDAYLNRYANRLTESSVFNRKQAESLCLDYLIEECAILCLWPSTGCHFEIHDGAHNSAMQKSLKRFVDQKQNYSFQMLNIIFNHRPNLNPQKLLKHLVCHDNPIRSYA
jgi:tRNA-dependent cyclodipeptide synthase